MSTSVSLALAVGLLLASAALIPSAPQSAEAVGPITVQQVVSGFDEPVGIVHAGDHRLFVIERGGLIRVYNGSTVNAAPFLDVSALLPTELGWEAGLLGLAFHPNYPSTPFFYIHYVNTADDIVLARYEVSANPNVANPSSGRIMRTIAHPAHDNHYGGQMAFGPDGFLYVAIGDGGGTGDPDNNAQDLTTFLGKMLRLDVDQNVTSPPYYGIPATNPFAGATAGLDEIWAFGLRNPWRFSFDRMTGDILIGDVGQEVREEIDFQPAASAGGENYGWRIMEGFDCYIDEGAGCFSATFTPPVLDYTQGGNGCSVTGGYLYRGMSPGFAGTYIYGDFCSGRIWSAAAGPAPWVSTLLIDSSYQISSFGEDVNGELYIVDYAGGTLGRLLLEDQDSDSLADQVDNCPTASNANQLNSDAMPIGNGATLPGDDSTTPNADRLGDACDDDNDNDGIPNATDAHPGNPRNATVEDNGDGNPAVACFGGTDVADDGVSWDMDCDGKRDGAPVQCGSTTADNDGDGLMDSWETCHWATSNSSTDSDSDGLGDCTEAFDVNGNGIVTNADAVFVAQAAFGVSPSDWTFDVNGNGMITNADAVLIRRSAFAVAPCS